MVGRLGVNRLLWYAVGFLSLIAAIAGLLKPELYNGLVNEEIMSGVMSQDIISVAASILIIVPAFSTRQEDSKKQIVILGLLGYLFYAYGIYVIERFYNVFYFLYMGIFALSFYAIICGVASMRREVTRRVEISNVTRIVSVGFSLLIPALFYGLWISQIVPLIRAGQKIEFMYSIYILDMCFLFPAFIIIAVMAAKKEGFGLILVPTIFIWGFTLLFSVALGGLLKPLYNQAMVAGEITLYLVVSTVFLALAIVYMRALKIGAIK